MNGLAILQKHRPEDALARLHSRNPYFVEEALFALHANVDMNFGTYSPPERIHQANESNRAKLEALPKASDVEELVDTVRKALAVCNEKNIRRQVAQLIGSFPNANPTDPETFIAALVFDLLDSQIPDAILILTCQDLRRSSRFVPAIAEVIKLANYHLNRWQKILTLPEMLPRLREKLEYAVHQGEEALKERNSGHCATPPTIARPLEEKAARVPIIHYVGLTREFAADQRMLELLGSLNADDQREASIALARRGKAAVEALIQQKQVGL